MSSLIVAAIVVVAVAVFIVIVFKAMWRVAEPNEALIISGIRDHGNPESAQEGLGFRIVTGRGTLIKPGIEAVRRLSLDLREADLTIDCVTHQGIPLGIIGDHDERLQVLAFCDLALPGTEKIESLVRRGELPRIFQRAPDRLGLDKIVKNIDAGNAA